MVFESVVADLLNRLLGDYFENFDSSKLSIGIWGGKLILLLIIYKRLMTLLSFTPQGDVVLRDLFLKTSALDDLGLPFKVVVGKLGNE